MLVAIPTDGDDLSGNVDQRFGRCSRFLLVDSETREFRVLANPAAVQSGGAGVTAAQTVIDQGARAVIAGEVGPKAYDVLQRAGVKVYARITGSARDALDLLSSQMVEDADGPTGPARHGR
jgi:predicted Fe-Mo cluster-binding NifX family protein